MNKSEEKANLVAKIEALWTLLGYAPKHRENSAKLWCGVSADNLFKAPTSKLYSYWRYLNSKYWLMNHYGQIPDEATLEEEIKKAKEEERIKDWGVLNEALGYLRNKEKIQGMREKEEEEEEKEPQPSNLGEMDFPI